MSLGLRTRQNLHAGAAHMGGTDLHGIAGAVTRMGDSWWLLFGLLGARWRMAEIDDGLVMVRLMVRRADARSRNREVLQEAGL